MLVVMARTNERQVLAEQWRLLGERLRERSPARFRKLVEMLVVSAAPDDKEIDDIYPFH